MLDAPRPTDDAALAEEIRVLDDCGIRGSRLVQGLAFLRELQRHRATMKRIEEFDLKLRGNTAIMGGSATLGMARKVDGSVSRAISDELRKAIKGGM